MRLVWTTDPHLNHVPLQAWERWIAENRSSAADGLLISGDISEGDDVAFQLQRISETIDLPIYFVLGNHDFYQSSIGKTRQRVIDVCRDHPHLFYLTDLDPLELSPGVSLVGEDGWGDATVGDYEGSQVRLNDFALIDDFRLSSTDGWKSLLQQLGKDSAQRLAQKLTALPADTQSVIVLTHVPPFREACWYEGHTTDDHWAPFFVCGETGEVLRRAARARPDCNFIVLCGHTHSDGIAHIGEKLVVYTGAAQYGHPVLEGFVAIADHDVVVSRKAPR